MFSIGKNYTIDMSLPFIIKISYSLKTRSPVVAFLFLPLCFSTFSLEGLSLRTAGISVRSKHFSKRSMSLCGPVKIYSHGISMPNPPPRLTAFPHTLTSTLVPGFARKCFISPKPSFTCIVMICTVH